MNKVRKQRVDQLLTERGLVESRSRAQAMIMAGLVYSDTRRIDKPGTAIAEQYIQLEAPLPDAAVASSWSRAWRASASTRQA